MKRVWILLIVACLTSIMYSQKVKDSTAYQYPSPKRAAMYSAIMPGLGQVYNKKFWKLPLIYGGIGSCVYFISWNNRNYKDYYNAYRDLTVKDANGNRVGDSYLNFIPGGDLGSINESFFESSLKQKKDYYKKNRDLSILILAGVYVLNIIDANVDAHFYNFDISRDLSLKLDPTIMPGLNANDILGLSMTFIF